MRPILSATSTYNYALAKWLEEKLKPLSYNKYSILDVFKFAEEIRAKGINEDDILVSYDVTSLFTNVPLDETIGILVQKAFKNNWFNLNITLTSADKILEFSLTSLLKINFYSLKERSTSSLTALPCMGSPLGPLMANVFMLH